MATHETYGATEALGRSRAASPDINTGLLSGQSRAPWPAGGRSNGQEMASVASSSFGSGHGRRMRIGSKKGSVTYQVEPEPEAQLEVEQGLEPGHNDEQSPKEKDCGCCSLGCCEKLDWWCCIGDMSPNDDSKSRRDKGREWCKTFIGEILTVLVVFPLIGFVFVLYLEVNSSSGDNLIPRTPKPGESQQGRNYGRKWTMRLFLLGLLLYTVVATYRMMRKAYKEGFRTLMRVMVDATVWVFQGAVAYNLVVTHQLNGGQPRIAPIHFMIDTAGYQVNATESLYDTTKRSDHVFVATSEMLYPAMAFVFLGLLRAHDMATFPERHVRQTLNEESNLVIYVLAWMVSAFNTHLKLRKEWFIRKEKSSQKAAKRSNAVNRHQYTYELAQNVCVKCEECMKKGQENFATHGVPTGSSAIKDLRWCATCASAHPRLAEGAVDLLSEGVSMQDLHEEEVEVGRVLPIELRLDLRRDARPATQECIPLGCCKHVCPKPCLKCDGKNPELAVQCAQRCSCITWPCGGKRRFYEFIYREQRKAKDAIANDWDTSAQMFAKEIDDAASTQARIRRSTRYMTDGDNSTILTRGGKDKPLIRELQYTLIEQYSYETDGNGYVKNGDKKQYPGYKKKAFYENYKAMMPPPSAGDVGDQEDDPSAMARTTSSELARVAAATTVDVNATLAQPVILAIQKEQQSPWVKNEDDHDNRYEGTPVFREDKDELPVIVPNASCREISKPGHYIGADCVVRMVKNLAQADRIKLHRWLWWASVGISFVQASLPSAYASFQGARHGQENIIGVALFGIGSSMLGGIFIGNGWRNDCFERVALIGTLGFMLFLGVVIDQDRIPEIWNATIEQTDAPAYDTADYHGWVSPFDDNYKFPCIWFLWSLASVTLIAVPLSVKSLCKQEPDCCSATCSEHPMAQCWLLRSVGVSMGAVVFIVAGLMEVHFRGKEIDLYDYFIAIGMHWLFGTVFPLSVLMVLLDYQKQSTSQLRRPIIFGSVAIASTILLIIGISGVNEHTKSFIVSYPLNFSITIRLMKCFECYYERYRRMLYFLQMTPWSTIKKKYMVETFGLLPTFPLTSKRNIVAWNKMRIFLERFEVKASRRRQHAVVYMLGAWVCIAIYQAIKFFNPTTNTIDTAAFFVFCNTVQLAIGLSLILYFGNLINELQATGIEHMLRIKQAEIISKRVNFLVEHSWTSIYGKAPKGDELQPVLEDALRPELPECQWGQETTKQAEFRRWWWASYDSKECRQLDLILPLKDKSSRAGECDYAAVNQARKEEEMRESELRKSTARTSRAAEVTPEDTAQQLKHASLSDLVKHARADGVTPMIIDHALDSDDSKTELLNAIHQARAIENADRDQLKFMRLSELRKYAIQVGVDLEQLDQALDGDDRYQRVIELIEARRSERSKIILSGGGGESERAELCNLPPTEYFLLDTLIETIKNEHGFGDRKHWGGEDRRAKLAFIYMDHRALMAFWSSVLAVAAPAVYQTVTAVFALDSDNIEKEWLHETCRVSSDANMTEQMDILRCYSEQMFLKLIEHDPNLVNQN